MEEKNHNSSLTMTNDKLTYHLSIKFNGKTSEFETDDLKKTIKSLKPIAVKTPAHIVIECDKGICDKMVMVKNLKMMFNKDIYLDMFINRLIFKKYA